MRRVLLDAECNDLNQAVSYEDKRKKDYAGTAFSKRVIREHINVEMLRIMLIWQVCVLIP